MVMVTPEVNNNAVLINPLVSKSTGYDMKDLTPLAVAVVAPLVLFGHAGMPVTDTKSLVDFASKQLQPLAYASAGGVGSLGHMSMESFARAAGVKLLHVPYTGGGPAQLAVSSGEVKMVMTTLNAGKIYFSIRYIQPDGNIGTATAYPYGNFD